MVAHSSSVPVDLPTAGDLIAAQMAFMRLHFECGSAGPFRLRTRCGIIEIDCPPTEPALGFEESIAAWTESRRRMRRFRSRR